jgi:uncharacterized membrane protein YhaH (DUF805 family)
MLVLFESIFKKGFKFEGRAGHKEYLIFTIFEFVIFTPILILEKKYGRTDILTIILFICIAIYFIPHTALTIRRLHDCGLRGWWYLLSLIFSPIIFLILSLIKGDKGPNKYGEPPEY